jgi:CheY-like chemotaxis protein
LFRADADGSLRSTERVCPLFTLEQDTRCRGADDDDIVRTIIRFFLETKGFEICSEATDGVDAIEKAEQLKPDLIVLDVAMPRMNGVEAASVLKGMMPDVPIIWFTMYNLRKSSA